MKIDGVDVVDAKKPVIVTISPHDTKRGRLNEPATCAVARALCRDCGALEARVHIGRTYLRIGGLWYRFRTPLSLRTEIVVFDRGGKFDPGEYVLMPLTPSQRATTKPTTPSPRKRKHPFVHMTGHVRERPVKET